MAEEKKPTGTGKSADSSKAAGAAKKSTAKAASAKKTTTAKRRQDGSESEKNCEADGAGGRDDSDSKGGKKNVTGSIGNG